MEEEAHHPLPPPAGAAGSHRMLRHEQQQRGVVVRCALLRAASCCVGVAAKAKELRRAASCSKKDFWCFSPASFTSRQAAANGVLLLPLRAAPWSWAPPHSSLLLRSYQTPAGLLPGGRRRRVEGLFLFLLCLLHD